ncbi:testicular acid phosphatase homolog isoform X3 [Planococcus citri]
MSKEQFYFLIFTNLCILRPSAEISVSFPRDLKLMKTIVIFRHGMRAPVKSFKFDPFAESDLQNVWPEGLDALVNEGKNQMFLLGKRLRERYEHLLKPYGSTLAEDVQMVTTASDRCYQSGALVLAGFYPPNSDQIWNDELLWQPISIHSPSPDKVHIKFGDKKECPRYHEEYEKALHIIMRNGSDTKVNHDFLMNFLANFSHSDNITSFSDLVLVGDYMKIKKSSNLKLPNWASDDFLDKLNRFHLDGLNSVIYNPELREMIVGPLIKDILDRIQDVMDDYSNNSKFYFYAGHDLSLMALFEHFNMKNDFVPTYESSFIFEVYRSFNGTYSIRSLFSDDYSLEHINVKVLQNCEIFCSASKFFQIFEKYLTLDWKKICNL